MCVAHGPGMPGTFSPPPASMENASLWSRHTSRHVRYARAVMHAGISILWGRGKRSRHSRRMRNPKFYVSGKRPITPNNHAWIIIVIARIFLDISTISLFRMTLAMIFPTSKLRILIIVLTNNRWYHKRKVQYYIQWCTDAKQWIRRLLQHNYRYTRFSCWKQYTYVLARCIKNTQALA